MDLIVIRISQDLTGKFMVAAGWGKTSTSNLNLNLKLVDDWNHKTVSRGSGKALLCEPRKRRATHTNPLSPKNKVESWWTGCSWIMPLWWVFRLCFSAPGRCAQIIESTDGPGGLCGRGGYFRIALIRNQPSCDGSVMSAWKRRMASSGPPRFTA